MARTLCVLWLVAVLLTACIQARQPTYSIRQTLPDVRADAAVYGGCVRAVARLAVRSHAYAVWTPKRIAEFCEEVRQSFLNPLTQPPERT